MWASLTTVVVGNDGDCLVVDPGITVAEIDQTSASLRHRGLKVVAGFSTHPHWDHVLWSAELGDVPRWATEAGVEAAARDRAHNVSECDALAPGHDHFLTGRTTPLPGPASSGAEIPWSGPRALVLEHRAHTPGHAALVLPESYAILAGDMLSDREVPLLDTDAPDPLGDYRSALEILETAVRTHHVAVIVPGHGTPASDIGAITDRFEADRRYLDHLERLAGSGRDDSYADSRLTDPWVAREHRTQLSALRQSRA